MVDDPAAVIADLMKATAHFQLRRMAMIMDAPLPIPGALSITLGQSGGQIADVVRKRP